MRESVTLDSFDLKLLASIQDDAALSNVVLAARIGLSASQVSRRRIALEQAGVIVRSRAVLDAEALGLAILVFIHVALDTHNRDNASLLKRLVEGDPNILEAYSLTGEADYLLKVIVEDLKDLSRVVNDVLLPHPAVSRVRSEIVLDTLKRDGGLPLGHLRRVT